MTPNKMLSTHKMAMVLCRAMVWTAITDLRRRMAPKSVCTRVQTVTSRYGSEQPRQGRQLQPHPRSKWWFERCSHSTWSESSNRFFTPDYSRTTATQHILPSYDAANNLLQMQNQNVATHWPACSYDQSSGACMGGSQTTYGDGGNSTSAYYNAENQLVATADFYKTANRRLCRISV